MNLYVHGICPRSPPVVPNTVVVLLGDTPTAIYKNPAAPQRALHAQAWRRVRPGDDGKTVQVLGADLEILETFQAGRE